MGSHRAPRARVVVFFAAALCVFTLAPAEARAQGGVPSGPPPPGNRDPFAEVRERQQREAQLRSAEMLGASKTNGRRGAEGAFEQMRDDFKRIQILRNKVVRHLQSDNPLDFKFIAEEAEEINKRAGRLRTNLVREAPEDEKKGQEKQFEISDSQVKAALVTMCKRIDSFTENPIFKVPDVVDVQQSAKAGRDLRDIIRLSDAVRKTAERLNKTSKN